MLIYALDKAPWQRKVLNDAIRQNSPIPDSIKDAPELMMGLALFYNSFFDLHGCRQLGDTLGPIDWIMIDRYCNRYDITGEQYDDMHFFISRMDFAYLERERAKTKQRLDQARREAERKTKTPRIRRSKR